MPGIWAHDDARLMVPDPDDGLQDRFLKQSEFAPDFESHIDMRVRCVSRTRKPHTGTCAALWPVRIWPSVATLAIAPRGELEL